MKVEIGFDVLDVDREIYCRDCKEIIIGKMVVPFIVVGEVTDSKYKWEYVRCQYCYEIWVNK